MKVTYVTRVDGTRQPYEREKIMAPITGKNVEQEIAEKISERIEKNLRKNRDEEDTSNSLQILKAL